MEFIVIIVVGFCLYVLFNTANQEISKSESKINLQSEKALAIKTYSEIRTQIKIPENCMKVQCTYGLSELEKKLMEGLSPNDSLNYFMERNTKLLRGLNFVWKNDNCICFFPTINCLDHYFKFSYLKFELCSIRIQDIVSFEREGEIYHENKISGGGGGGSSIGNAIVGGVIAGGAGAIVASRKKTEAITSELIDHDDRACILTYIQNNIMNTAAFSYFDYAIFKELIPEKDIIVVDKINRRNVIEKHSTSQTDNIQKIRDLGTLRDEGFLSE